MGEIVSYMDAYRTGPDVIFPIPPGGMSDYAYGDMTLSIHKMGGGMLGESYAGTWIIEVHYKGELIYSDASLETPTPHTHLQAACVAADFLANGDSAYEPFGDRLYEWSNEYVSDAVRESVM